MYGTIARGTSGLGIAAKSAKAIMVALGGDTLIGGVMGKPEQYGRPAGASSLAGALHPTGHRKSRLRADHYAPPPLQKST